jgi:hypothetical protein
MKDLTPEQRTAIGLLVQGKTDQEVAAVIGVTGDTTTRWRRQDPRVVAALNRERKAGFPGENAEFCTLL